jgi:hypothetical protein
LIAQKIAGTLYNYNCFEGLKDKKKQIALQQIDFCKS